jgi:hypothetical protein
VTELVVPHVVGHKIQKFEYDREKGTFTIHTSRFKVTVLTSEDFRRASYNPWTVEVREPKPEPIIVSGKL